MSNIFMNPQHVTTRHNIMIRTLRAFARNYGVAQTRSRRRDLNEQCKSYLRAVFPNRWEAQKYYRFYKNERREALRHELS